MGYLRAWVMGGGTFILVHFVISLSFFSSKMGVMGRTWNETDRLALLEFKAKITDDPLGIMSLWNDSAHFCDWHGVKCGTRHQRVVELNMHNLKLKGTISPHIGNLSFLHALRLQSNSFIHQIPSEIGRLRRLQELKLGGNKLGGKIPPNLSNCSELRYLLLTANTLEGEIPLELGLMSKLRHLSLSYNNLVGNIPTNLTSLSQLTLLALNVNHLSGEVPSSLFNLSSLEQLDIGSNHLGRRLPPDLFLTLPNLQYTSIMNNQFSGRIPVSLSNASNLQDLELTQNKFTGKVPCLGNPYMLSFFSVAENNLGSGDGAQDDLNFLCCLTNATTLYYLDIQSNNFGGVLPSCIINLSSKLAHFVMNRNSISGTIPQGIGNLTGLQALDFSYNSFTSTIPPTIGNLRNLVILYLNYNSFSGRIPTSFGNLLELNQLVLQDNSLEGTIPLSLRNCSALQILVLEFNNLTGFIPPQLFTIPSLSIHFSVSHNQLTGPLPEEVGKLTNLNKLDVSSNMLSGKIPQSIGECVSLVNLFMGGNNFQGPIPSSYSSLRGLQQLDLSSNNLSGPIPQFFTSFVALTMLSLSFNDLEGAVPKKGVFTNSSITSLQGNNKLCGGIPEFHLPECSSSSSLEKKKWKSSTKAKITIASVAGSIVVALSMLLLYVLGKKWRQGRGEHNVGPSENPPLAFQFVSYGDLHRASNGFSQGSLIGEGSFGRVYKGVLGEGGHVVAIKVLNLKQRGASKSFVAECQALRNIRHKNLVKLLTVCSGIDYQGNEFKALVYEFMSNGSLEDWLHPPATRDDEVVHEQTPPRKLSLFKRLSIVIDVASLLEYVHHEFGSPLVHCDIKPSNILLDGDLSAHVSDFGLAKFLLDMGIIRNNTEPSSSIGVRGTIGYAPLEYGAGGEVSTQGDVYSYGILLLEIFTGKRPTHEMFKDGLNLHLYSKMALPSGVINILDPSLQDLSEAEEPILNPKRSARVMDCLVSVIEIGVACSVEAPAERMDMRMVTKKLQKIKDVISRGTNY